VEKSEIFATFVPAVEMMFSSFDVGNPAVGVAVEMGRSSRNGLMFLKIAYGICGWGSGRVDVIPLWLNLRGRSPAIRWGHCVVCFKVD